MKACAISFVGGAIVAVGISQWISPSPQSPQIETVHTSLAAGGGSCCGCAADINGDNVVGVPDLLQVISNWGPCLASPEICGDGCDNDNDGFIDCADFDCFGSPKCPEICNDGIDNDGDGFIDCFDFDCFGSPGCPEICDDGMDNDGDGFIDCADFDCIASPNCTTAEICNDGVDNDGDGFTDCADFDCVGSPLCP